MARPSPQALKDRRQEFLDEVGKAFDQMLGNGDRNGLISFEQRENRACELGDALTRRLLEEHLAAEEDADPGVEVPCPICGRPVVCQSPQRVELEPRRVRTRRGVVDYERAARRCKYCRRVSFPL